MRPITPKIFPIDPIPTGNLAASAGREAFEEANAFSGRRWTDIDRDFCHKYTDALCWFTPEAFCYYLPAFLAAAIAGKGFDELFAGSIVRLLKEDTNPNLNFFRKERWSKLTEAQADALLHWLRLVKLRVSDRDPEMGTLNAAIENVENRAWRDW